MRLLELTLDTPAANLALDEALLEQADTKDSETKIGAIEKARIYLERFLNEERVFRDLFFVLAG